MKFSKGLLENTELRSRVFQNGLVKTKTLLSDVFSLDFQSDDPCITELEINETLYNFKLTFIFNGCTITAVFGLENVQDDIFEEVLRINELNDQVIPFSDTPLDFPEAISCITDMLEQDFGVSIPSLDPEEKDPNVSTIKLERQSQGLEILFSADGQEGVFRALYQHTPDRKPSFRLLHHNQQVIHLE